LDLVPSFANRGLSRRLVWSASGVEWRNSFRGKNTISLHGCGVEKPPTNTKKSPPCYVTLLITVQLACNNSEVVNPSKPQLIRSSPTPFNTAPPGSFTSETDYGAIYKYLNSIIILNSILNTFLTQLFSSHSSNNISPLFMQFHCSRSLRTATHCSMNFFTNISSCCHAFKMIQFCIVYHKIVLPEDTLLILHSRCTEIHFFQFCWNGNQYKNLGRSFTIEMWNKHIRQHFIIYIYMYMYVLMSIKLIGWNYVLGKGAMVLLGKDGLLCVKASVNKLGGAAWG
jgi:hypothetical protein